MKRELQETSLWVSHLLLDAGKAMAGPALAAAVIGAALYIWLAGASITVTNESGNDLKDVTLNVGHASAGIERIWRTELSRGEIEWAYTFTGKDRAVLHFSAGDADITSECLYESTGLAVSVSMKIRPDNTVTCDSTMRL